MLDTYIGFALFLLGFVFLFLGLRASIRWEKEDPRRATAWSYFIDSMASWRPHAGYYRMSFGLALVALGVIGLLAG